MLWLSERDARRQLEAEQREILAALDSERQAVESFESRLEQERDERRKIEKHLAESETARIHVEHARRKLVDLVGQLAAESNADRQDSASDSDSAVTEVRLAEARARIALAQRLNHAIREYGGAELRVHEVDAADGTKLSGLRLLRLDPNGVPDGLFRAESARIEVERTAGVATFVLANVTRTIGGVSLPPDDEWKIRFELDEPRAFVAELAPLVIEHGEWPSAPTKKREPIERVLEARVWMERFDSFLEGIDGPRRYRLQRIGKVDLPSFLDVEILGCSATGRWDERIRAARVSVWVDAKTGRVELRLRDGYIESVRGKLALPKDRDYRMHLPDIRAVDAERALMGFVRRDL